MSVSRLETKIKQFRPAGVKDGISEIEIGSGPILVHSCSSAGRFVLSMAVTAVELTSNKFDLAICPLTISNNSAHITTSMIDSSLV